MSTIPNKHDQRRAMRSLRQALSPAERVSRSAKAAQCLRAWLTQRKAQSVALFVSLADEIDTQPLFDLLRDSGTRIALPRVRITDTHLDFVVAHDLKTLEPGPFRLLEPVGDPVPLSSLDVIVVPGLAFDHQGGRLGYGAGYYDRALADHAGPRVGYGYRFQLLDEPLALAPHDLPMTAIAHDEGIFEVTT